MQKQAQRISLVAYSIVTNFLSFEISVSLFITDCCTMTNISLSSGTSCVSVSSFSLHRNGKMNRSSSFPRTGRVFGSQDFDSSDANDVDFEPSFGYLKA